MLIFLVFTKPVPFSREQRRAALIKVAFFIGVQKLAYFCDDLRVLTTKAPVAEMPRAGEDADYDHS